MKICDVVMNSIWFDPRVRKQISSYLSNGHDLECVGFYCKRYAEDMVDAIPCTTNIVQIDNSYYGHQKGIYRKLKREYLRMIKVRDAIIEAKPDIVHANDLDALVPAYLAKKKMNFKIVYDSHEVFVENNVEANRPLWRMIWSILEKRAIKKVDQMVCVSNAAAEYFQQKYGIEKPMVVTHGALQNEIVGINNEKNGGFELINHGQFYEGRGYDLMVEAADLLRDYPDIHMCLRGFGKLESQLKDRAEQLKLDNVIFYPKVKVEELIPLASRSMVGLAITEPICLNFKLSVSNKLFEYAAAGLPVIMSDIPEHRYLNDKYHFGVILPENTPKALADAVLRLYQDKKFYAECQKNSCKMSEECNWETEFAKLLNKEKELIENEQ